tara:strand:+ start:746 stop:1015 length:270 start_codon:yes stop_codon:yes gene_type:complete
MSRILLKGDEITVPLVAVASSFSEATVVRLANPSTTDYVISVTETRGGTSVGSFTLLADSTELLEKQPTHVVFVNADTAVKGTKVGFTN